MTHPLSGSLLGTAAGDAYGLPYEGLSPRRIGKRFVPRRYALIPLLHGGMVSDDTEHAVMTAQAWINGAGDPEIFRRSLRGRLKWWFARLPAGIGLATLRSCLKMWLGLERTGVYSAGNGPAMRAPVLGVLCDDLDELRRLVKISTELTPHRPQSLSRRTCRRPARVVRNPPSRLDNRSHHRRHIAANRRQRIFRRPANLRPRPQTRHHGLYVPHRPRCIPNMAGLPRPPGRRLGQPDTPRRRLRHYGGHLRRHCRRAARRRPVCRRIGNMVRAPAHARLLRRFGQTGRRSSPQRTAAKSTAFRRHGNLRPQPADDACCIGARIPAFAAAVLMQAA